MASLGSYCKAYYARDFRRFRNWTENLASLKPENRSDHGEESVPPEGTGRKETSSAGAADQELDRDRTELRDDAELFLHENYTVTDGIYVDEHVIFADVTEEWKDFCHRELDFEVSED